MAAIVGNGNRWQMPTGLRKVLTLCYAMLIGAIKADPITNALD
jgi:hypothetical protein